METLIKPELTHSIIFYIESREDYTEKLIEVYEGSIDEQRSDYAERAEDIISEWESENL